ncbi:MULTISPECIES: PIN domain-containing protein [unclassified Streptomyces]|uniref:PIN domain-containing protein n=1 Tax=unclassified Streptomyces TaxID=2593676 RepID=UPI00148894D3|nr:MULTISPECIES: PIN domain-containing protein [unclassified Streptomyces]
MIILDANILKSTSLRSPAADMLRAIRAAKVERVAAPWIAMEEIAAQQVLSYQAKHDAALEAVDTLRKATPWADIVHPKRFDDEHVRKHWRARYSEIADVIQTPASAYQMAMFRETNLLAPCKTVNNGKNKTGARDAAIWLTAVEYARKHPKETVYFVSNNTEDFGDGTSFPSPMDKDLRGLENRFFLFTSLDGVLKKFATEVDAEVEDVQALLDTEESHTAVLEAARGASRRFRTVYGSVLYEDGMRGTLSSARGWDPRAVALDTVSEVSAREIDGHKWFTASVRWLFAEDGHQVRRFGRECDRVAYAWQTRVLLSPTASDSSLTILDSKRPGPVSRDDVPNVPIIVESEELTALLEAALAGDFSGSSVQFRQILNALRHGMTDHSTRETALRLLADKDDAAAFRLLRNAVHDLSEEDTDEAP